MEKEYTREQMEEMANGNAKWSESAMMIRQLLKENKELKEQSFTKSELYDIAKDAWNEGNTVMWETFHDRGESQLTFDEWFMNVGLK